MNRPIFSRRLYFCCGKWVPRRIEGNVRRVALRGLVECAHFSPGVKNVWKMCTVQLLERVREFRQNERTED
jgi:hypothetical protein